MLKSQFGRNQLFVGINLTNNKYINAHLDYSVQAKHGDHIDVNGLRFKEGFNDSEKKPYFIIKGNVINN